MKRTYASVALAAFLLILTFPALASAEPDILSLPELEDARGGFTTPDGVTFDINAVASAFIDGDLVLKTELSGAQADAFAVRTGADGGETTIRQLSSADFLGNIVTNTASERAVSLNLDITVLVSNFAASQRDFAWSRAVTDLENAAQLR